ncbi:MAG TPA: alpha-mannosidase [Thermomicrobiales bacterium]|nr:alpha-mannosidase [Thermomicrobiales bacterium]
MDEITLRKYAARVTEIETTVERRSLDLPPLRLAPAGAGGPAATAGKDWPELPVGAAWGGYGVTVWLHGDVIVPDDWAGETVVLRLRLGDYRQIPGDILIAGPEAMAYLDGVPWCGIDRNHADPLLAASAQPGARHSVAIEAYAGRIATPHLLREWALATRDPDAAGLAADLRAAYDTLRELDPSGGDAALLGRAIDAALGLVDFRRPRSDDYYASLAPARAAFAAALKGYQHGTRPRLVATGHAHIDVAWLWPLAQTRRKAARTFATVLRLMEQYPEYHFTQSQPQLYQFIKEDEPALYAQIKARVAEGRWELTGAMWLEPDTNVPNGESLARQIMCGQRFYEREFGQRTSLVWLPDVFGYSAALPQIMRAAGIAHFMTSKISWNQTNKFPYDTFRWRGLDGSEVLAYFITTPERNSRIYTYNGHMDAREVRGDWEVYRQKDINDEILYLFGLGDGGGGPTRAMLESGRRLGNLPGMPALAQGSAERLLDRIAARVYAPENVSQLPTWAGELYFEYHRGTYTSQGRTKQAHRRAEGLLHEAELWQVAADTLDPAGPPPPPLDRAWELLLLQEFHDILPGSSVPEVYADAARDLAAVSAAASASRDASLDRLVASIDRPTPALVVFNSLPWPRRDPVEVALGDTEPAFDADGEALTVQPLANSDNRALVAPPAAGVPPHGYARWAAGGDGTRASELHITERVLENAFYRLELDDTGLLRSLRDKRAGDREVIAPDERGNRLIAFEDKPLNFDAWDIDPFYVEKPYPIEDLAALRVVETGPLRGGVEITRRFLDSTIVQRIFVYRDISRIDFQTEIDWQQKQILLKAAFPVAVHAARATYEIQFGALERGTTWNTSWDRARFEVCAQRWADLSEGDYGVALLNDGKYGYDIHDNVLRLTLLKSANSPDPTADLGRHAFTYSLLPHQGDWRAAEVVAQAAALNLPLVGRVASAGAGPLQDARYSLVTCDRPGLVIDTIKPALDGQGVILRLYEAHGTRGPATLRFAHPISAAETCTLLEERAGAVAQPDATTLRLTVRPYELLTLRVVWASRADGHTRRVPGGRAVGSG